MTRNDERPLMEPFAFTETSLSAAPEAPAPAQLSPAGLGSSLDFRGLGLEELDFRHREDARAVGEFFVVGIFEGFECANGDDVRHEGILLPAVTGRPPLSKLGARINTTQ